VHPSAANQQKVLPCEARIISPWPSGTGSPINGDKGVEAIETLKRITASAQRGFTSAANDECTIAPQQDLAVQGLQWATRCASMDNEQQSRVVGLVDWAAAPGGNARLSGDGYAMSCSVPQF
jgi:multiple sugar transport system substrate-binding protein